MGRRRRQGAQAERERHRSGEHAAQARPRAQAAQGDVMIDTLTISRNLRSAGFSEAQADAVTAAVRDAAAVPNVSQLVTKADLITAMAELKFDLLKWIVGLLVGSTIFNSAVVALVAFLARMPR